MKILVELRGDELDIKDIMLNTKTGEWKIIAFEDKLCLTSDFLHLLENDREILSKSIQFLDAANGAANILYGNHRQVTPGGLIKIEENGNRHATVFLSGSIESRSRFHGELTIKGKENVVVPSTMDSWIEMGSSNDAVRDTLHFFNEVTWWNLYKVLEIIKDDIGGNKGEHKKRLYKLVDKKKLNDFTQNVQSRKAIGDLARHASKKFKPSGDSITLKEAFSIIKELYINWVSIKK